MGFLLRGDSAMTFDFKLTFNFYDHTAACDRHEHQLLEARKRPDESRQARKIPCARCHGVEGIGTIWSQRPSQGKDNESWRNTTTLTLTEEWDKDIPEKASR